MPKALKVLLSKVDTVWFSQSSHHHLLWPIHPLFIKTHSIMLGRENESESLSIVSHSLGPHRLYSPWNSPGQNTGVGSLSLLQGIFWTQESNWGLLCCRRILYQLSHKGSPRILEWVAYPFSSTSSQPRNWTGVPCTAGPVRADT